jgi:hypothetical protein
MPPRLISDRFLDRRTGIVHLGEKNERDMRSEWPWFKCGLMTGFTEATELPLTCMGCAADVSMHDWMKGPHE